MSPLKKIGLDAKFEETADVEVPVFVVHVAT